jgi:hypothetical protein
MKHWQNKNAENGTTMSIEKEISIENLQHFFSSEYPDDMSLQQTFAAISVRNCLLALGSGL